MNVLDMRGSEISVGDTIAYATGRGSGAAFIKIGVVVKINIKKGVAKLLCDVEPDSPFTRKTLITVARHKACLKIAKGS